MAVIKWLPTVKVEVVNVEVALFPVPVRGVPAPRLVSPS